MLQARDITFAYGRRCLFEGIGFTVASGEIVALTGLNGAGKTTLMRILSGTLAPTSGCILADGADIARDSLRYRRRLGYLPENAPIDPAATVKGYLKFRAKLKGEQSRKIRHRVQEALEACLIGEIADATIAHLSNGQRRRVALAEALLLRPRYLFADDLLAGVDAATRAALGETLGTFAQFASVIVSGHELEDFGRFATRFFVLKNGHLAVCANAAEAREEMAS